MIRAVLFDAGNTLMHLDYEFIAEVLAQHGHPTTPMAIRIAEYGAKAAIDRELAPEMAAPESVAENVEGLLWPDESGERPSYFAVALHYLGVPRTAMKPMLEALREHNATSCLWRVVLPGTTDVLSALQARGLTLAVISNADGRIEGDLERAGLKRHFATVVDSHVVGVEKPNPAIFHLTLDRIGAAANEAVYVGDVFAIDVLGARKAGLDAVLVDTLDRYPGRVDCPRIKELSELLRLLPA
ncbi:MAG: HAD-IA family hydrolase [Deltaproteobacteria bacterium]|nr:HAD-IA family hydrolase [Deltaproteobacteria bacterium]MBI3390425.1 HAD-IA family hydrolase [Deltaproteobacteria bacterium]